MVEALPPAARVEVIVWRDGIKRVSRDLPAEVAVALSYDSITFAVMMASPVDLQDFAIGFSLSEGIIEDPSEITDFELAVLPLGLECRMRLAPAPRNALATRRRRIAGPVGCGLCGVDSLGEVIRRPAKVHTELQLTANQVQNITVRLPALQLLNTQTRAVHAAAFFSLAEDKFWLREDVGRHNALDKVIGAVRRDGKSGAEGVVLLTSRVSIELVQKTASFGAGILIAVSVPSARAVLDAQAAGITLIAVAREDGFEIFTHPERIILACEPSRSIG